MSLLGGVLGMGRAQNESRFTETLEFFSRVEGVIPDGQIDPVTVETILYSGVPGQVKSPATQVADREQAGQLVAVQQTIVKVAVGATPNVRTDHFCRVTASIVDTSLVGREFRISGWPQSGQVTSHRYPVEQVS